MSAFSLSTRRHHSRRFPWLPSSRRSRSAATSESCAAESITWPEDLTLESMRRAIAEAHGLEIVVRPIPSGLSHPEISGLTTINGRTVHVFFDASLSPLNREQTILHEFAHIIHGDVQADSDSTHMRSMFDDPVEKRAETTGMRLLELLHRRGRPSGHEHGSEVLAFLSGADRGGPAR